MFDLHLFIFTILYDCTHNGDEPPKEAGGPQRTCIQQHGDTVIGLRYWVYREVSCLKPELPQTLVPRKPAYEECSINKFPFAIKIKWKFFTIFYLIHYSVFILGIISERIDVFVRSWPEFKFPALIAAGLKHSHRFAKSHCHFLTIVRSATSKSVDPTAHADFSILSACVGIHKHQIARRTSFADSKVSSEVPKQLLVYSGDIYGMVSILQLQPSAEK